MEPANASYHCHDDGALRIYPGSLVFHLREARSQPPGDSLYTSPRYAFVPCRRRATPALPLKDNPPGLEHVAVIGDLESGFGILLDQ